MPRLEITPTVHTDSVQAPLVVVKKTLCGITGGCSCCHYAAVFICQNNRRVSSYRRLSISGLELNKLIGLFVSSWLLAASNVIRLELIVRRIMRQEQTLLKRLVMQSPHWKVDGDERYVISIVQVTLIWIFQLAEWMRPLWLATSLTLEILKTSRRLFSKPV
jgi:hypothetical protein